MRNTFLSLVSLALVLAVAVAALADGEVNLYSHRHYDTDKVLYNRFEKQTGIKVT